MKMVQALTELHRQIHESNVVVNYCTNNAKNLPQHPIIHNLFFIGSERENETKF